MMTRSARKRAAGFIIAALYMGIIFLCPAYAELSNYQSADYVVGQPDMASNSYGTTAYNLYGPFVYSDGVKLYVADYWNNRVLIYNSIPTANNASANVVVGQPDMTSSGTFSDTTSYQLKNPSSVYAGGGKLYITDKTSNRVLIYDPIPVSNNASASIVLGADAMAADGAGAGASGLAQPSSLYSDGTKLYVADRVHHRVLIYNSIPTSNLASADVVIGQANMTATASGIAADRLNNPYSVYAYGTKLFVADSTNHRVLIYNPIPTSNGASASVVIGQSNMTSNGFNTTAYSLHGPGYAYTPDGIKLYVTDSTNSRVLIYNTIPTSNNASADVVVGQPDMITGTGGLAADKANVPYSAYADGTKLYVADYSNNRVLIYDPIPTSNGASASVVVGQVNMASGGLALTASNLYGPESCYVSGSKLYVADRNNDRVLVYDPIPTSNGASASVVIGQPNMTGGGGGTTAYKLDNPGCVFVQGTKLYVADSYNDRVLIYNSIPTSNNASANIVLGPNPMTSSIGGTTAYTLSSPNSVYVQGSRLYVGDYWNHRVLIYNSMPASNLPSADVVVGQPDMTTDTPGTTAYNLYNPAFASSDGTRLYVADTTNKRVLIYNSIPSANNASASIVVGQANMTSATGGIAAYQLNAPVCVYSNGIRLYITDASGSHRILVYNSIPTANNASADVRLGVTQAGAATASTLDTPISAFLTNTKLYVADYGNNRVLIYNEAVGRTMTIEGNITVEGAVTAE